MNRKLSKSFYQRPAEQIARDLLGKYLVHNTPEGTMSGQIADVEAYPAFSDDCSHGNRRTARTEVMYGEGGHAYIYLVYGIHYQFAIVVNRKGIPEVVFIRAVVPEEGVDLMRRNFQRKVKHVRDLTKSPGNLCKSFGISLEHYGDDLTAASLFLENRGVEIADEDVVAAVRVGIKPTRKGSQRKLRFTVRPNPT